MDKQAIEEKIQEITQKIVKEFQPEKIILFGSYAWGTPGPDSDVDLFIVKDMLERRIDRARMARKIIWGSGLPIDILVYTSQEVKKRMELEDFFVENVIKRVRCSITEEARYLTEFYIETRYPGDYPEFSKKECRKALDAAITIKEFVLDKIK